MQIYMSRCTKITTICICKNKYADQLCSKCTADQRLCFRYTDSSIPPLPLPKISSLLPASVNLQAGLCKTLSEPQFDVCVFFTHRLISLILAAYHLVGTTEAHINYIADFIKEENKH